MLAWLRRRQGEILQHLGGRVSRSQLRTRRWRLLIVNFHVVDLARWDASRTNHCALRGLDLSTMKSLKLCYGNMTALTSFI